MQRLLCLGLVFVLLKSKDTFNEFKHPQLHVLQEQPNTDCREVAVSHFFVFQHPLEEPLQMGLSRLQSLTTPGKVGYVRSPLSRNTHKVTHYCSVMGGGGFSTEEVRWQFRGTAEVPLSKVQNPQLPVRGSLLTDTSLSLSLNDGTCMCSVCNSIMCKLASFFFLHWM